MCLGRAWIVMVAVMCVVASCSRAPTGLAYEFASLERAACRGMTGDTPEAMTEAYFHEHINEAGISTIGNPLGCVWARFNNSELKRHAGAGDPVARLALVIKKNAREGKICESFPDAERELLGAFHLKEVEIYGHKISRVPEAIFFLDLITMECEIEYPLLTANNVDYGFDYSVYFALTD